MTWNGCVKPWIFILDSLFLNWACDLIYIAFLLKLELLFNMTLLSIYGLCLHIVIMAGTVTWDGCVIDTGIVTLDFGINKTGMGL